MTICEQDSVIADPICTSRAEGWYIGKRKKRDLPEGGLALTIGSSSTGRVKERVPFRRRQVSISKG